MGIVGRKDSRDHRIAVTVILGLLKAVTLVIGLAGMDLVWRMPRELIHVLCLAWILAIGTCFVSGVMTVACLAFQWKVLPGWTKVAWPAMFLASTGILGLSMRLQLGD